MLYGKLSYFEKLPGAQFTDIVLRYVLRHVLIHVLGHKLRYHKMII